MFGAYAYRPANSRFGMFGKPGFGERLGQAPLGQPPQQPNNPATPNQPNQGNPYGFPPGIPTLQQKVPPQQAFAPGFEQYLIMPGQSGPNHLANVYQQAGWKDIYFNGHWYRLPPGVAAPDGYQSPPAIPNVLR